MKKNIALFSVWIVLFATFGPIPVVNGITELNTEDCGASHCSVFLDSCSPTEKCIKELGYKCRQSEDCSSVGGRVESYESDNEHIRCFDPEKGVIDYADRTETSVCVACKFKEVPENINCCACYNPTKTLFWSTNECGGLQGLKGYCTTQDKNECGANRIDNSYPSQAECRVVNFYLPQDVSTDWKDPKSWISGIGDPDYVIYYEAFPEGEEEAWQIPGNEMLIYYLVIEGVLTAVTHGGSKILKKAGDTAAGQEAANLIKAAVKRVSSHQIGKFVLDVGAKTPVLKRLATFIMNVGEEESEEVLEETMRSIALNGAKEGAKDTGGWVEKNTFYGTLDDVAQGMFDKGLVKAGAAETTKSLVKNTFKETLKAGFKRAKTMPANRLKELLNKNKMELAKDGWENPVMRMYAIEMYDEIDKTWGDDEKDEFWDLVIKAGIVSVKPGRGVKNTVKVASVLTVLGYATSWSDSIAGKFVSTGVNDMAMHIPFYPTTELSLGSEAHKYYVELVRDSGLFKTSIDRQNPQRFFLASPCKADLTVRTAMRSCAMIGSSNENELTTVDDEKKQWEYYTSTDSNGNPYLVEMAKLSGPDNKAPESAGAYINEDFNGIKRCEPEGFFEDIFFGKDSHPSIPAIQIKANMYSGDGMPGNKNFCYAGSHLWQKSARNIILIGSLLASGTGFGTVVAIPVSAVGTYVIDSTEYWPRH